MCHRGLGGAPGPATAAMMANPTAHPSRPAAAHLPIHRTGVQIALVHTPDLALRHARTATETRARGAGQGNAAATRLRRVLVLARGAITHPARPRARPEHMAWVLVALPGTGLRTCIRSGRYA